MRTTLALTLLLAFSTLPLAAAGGDAGATVTYDDSNPESCNTSESWYWHDYSYSNEFYWSNGYGYGSQRHESCESDHTTAAVSASDREGELAYVGLDGQESSTEQSNQSYNYDNSGWNWSNGNTTFGGSGSTSTQTWGDHATRDSWNGATARAAGEEVAIGTTCTSNWRSDGQYSYGSQSSYGPYGYDSWSGQSQNHHYTYSDECRRGADTSIANREAAAGHTTGCESDDTSNSYSSERPNYPNGSSEYWGGDQTRTSSCWDGAYGNAAGESVWAGRSNACDSQHYWQSSSDANGTTAYEYEHDESECRNGVFVEAPAGIAFFVGTETEEWSDCYYDADEDECWNSQWTQTGVRLTWAQDPTGSGGAGIFAPLP